MLQLFNLSWQQVTEKIPEIAEAGYTSLWLPPPTKGGSGYSIGYDLWDPFDLGDKDQRGTVATRYGTKQELIEMVRIAHRFGLRVYFDNIVNHRAFDVPGYDANTPTNLYPGMVPGDFHLRVTSDGFYRNVSNIRDYNDVWQVQNLSLLGLLDIAHENPNANFGLTEGATAPKPVLVRHPGNPEYYDYTPGGHVGFGNVSQSLVDSNPTFYGEDVNSYLIRSVRYLIDQTKCDGLRLDAVKHVPAYFFGQQSGADKDTSNAGYVGNAQLQYNFIHGFTDANHRNSNFDTETARNDALIFGEHLGEPPAFSEYIDAGMRLLDNPLRNYINSVLGNPGSSLAGLEQRDSGGLGASVRVMHAQSHDNDYAAHRELQNAYYFLREGVPLIYSDGYFKSPSNGGTPFPRHANAPYLGEFGDNKMPDLAWLHHQLARGGTRPRWGDADTVAFERYDYREGSASAPQDQTVALFVMNDNYGNPGDISFDDGVSQSDDGMPSTCYPVVNSRNQGLVVGFPPGSHLRQLSDSPAKDRACPELVVRLATQVFAEAQASANDPNPVNRKVFVGTQALAPGGGAVELKIPSGSYVVYGYQWPEASRVDATLTNSLGIVEDTDVIVIQQNGRTVPRLTLYRTDGPDGDGGFNPIYPLKMRGTVGANGAIASGTHVSNLTYSISVPVVTNAPIDILVRTDGSTVNSLLKLDGGIDLNSHLLLGASNTFTSGVLDLRDNKPGPATDVFLGYEDMRFGFRNGPEKFAARNVVRDTVQSFGAETYFYTVGSDATTNRVDGSGFGNDYPEETCTWVYHDPAANQTVTGSSGVRQRSFTGSSVPVDIWVKAGYQFQVNRCFIYYTTDGSNPEGAYGTGNGTTRTVQAGFAGDDAQDGTIDWWKGTIPSQPTNTIIKYKIALFKTGANTIADHADSKHYALTQFAITNWNPATAKVWVHNNLNTNDLVTGLPEGLHILRARSFLQRSNKSSVFNTFLQTFYYDALPPDGVIAFPSANGATITSTDYDVVVRADETATIVEYNIIDADPNNDDSVTGFNNGNGLTNGVPVFAPANPVSPGQSLNQQYPALPQEFRFTWFAVPSNGTATITVRIKEATSDLLANHYKILTRTVTAAAPPQTLSIAFPSSNGQTINLNASNTYEIVACFSDTLTADPNLFTISIDGAFQPRIVNGAATYRFAGNYCGQGKRDLRYTWSGMNAGQHYIQINYNGDGLNLQASRLVRVNLFGVVDSDGDGLPDSWETQNHLNPADATGDNGPEGDPDHDGFSNLAEYLAGTDPNDPASLLRILNLSNGGQVISWQSVPGKNYQVYSTPSLTQALEPLSGDITAYNQNASFTNNLAVGPRFYRIRLVP